MKRTSKCGYAKQLCFALCLMVTCAITLNAQSYFTYTPEGKTYFELSKAQILVKFKAALSFEQRQQVVGKETQIAPLEDKELYEILGVHIVQLQNVANEKTVEQLLERLNQLDDIVYANPYLIYKDGTQQGIMDEFYVKLKSPKDLTVLNTMAKNHQAKITEQDEFMPLVYYLKADKQSKGNALELANRFSESGLFEYAGVNFLRHALKHSTNDPDLPRQWALENRGNNLANWGIQGVNDADMDVVEAWVITKGEGIKIAIIDDGVDLNHEDLRANLLPGFDATGRGSRGSFENIDGNQNSHGTGCAGLAAAVGDNGIGIAGVAYKAKILPIRWGYAVEGGRVISEEADAGRAINWAWQNGADVLSNSWAGGSPNYLTNDAIDRAVTEGRNGKGAIVLFSSGNFNREVLYPAYYPPVIAVGATSMCDERKRSSNNFNDLNEGVLADPLGVSCDGQNWWGSNYGTGLDVAAPGPWTASTDLTGSLGSQQGDYTFFGGTSAACPNAAGVVALILSANPNLTGLEARQVLESTCDKVGGYNYFNNSAQPNGTWSEDLGYGRVNAYGAVLRAKELAGGGGSSCRTPTSSDLSVSQLTTNSVQLNCGIEAEAYYWAFRAVSTETWMYIDPTTQAFVTVNGLSSDTEYEFYVKIYCNANWTDWGGPQNFTTLASGGGGGSSCGTPRPSDLSVSQLSTTSAQLNCSIEAGHYDWAYRQVGTNEWQEVDDTAQAFTTLNGLSTNTEYEFYVVVRCDGTWSDWGGPQTFTTASNGGGDNGGSNDDPCGATVLSPSSSCTFQDFTTENATRTSMSPALSGCGTAITDAMRDIWFRVNIPANGQFFVNTDAGTLSDGVMAFYGGDDCTNMFEFHCIDDATYQGETYYMPFTTIAGPAGAPVYIRFWGYGGETGNFGICVVASSNSPNTNIENRATRQEYGVLTANPVYLPSNAAYAMKNKQQVVINLSPNPANTSFTLDYQLPMEGEATVRLLDLNGQVIQTQAQKMLENEQQQLQFDVSDLAVGVYLVQIITAHEQFTRRVLVTR